MHRYGQAESTKRRDKRESVQMSEGYLCDCWHAIIKRSKAMAGEGREALLVGGVLGLLGSWGRGSHNTRRGGDEGPDPNKNIIFSASHCVLPLFSWAVLFLAFLGVLDFALL